MSKDTISNDDLIIYLLTKALIISIKSKFENEPCEPSINELNSMTNGCILLAIDESGLPNFQILHIFEKLNFNKRLNEAMNRIGIIELNKTNHDWQSWVQKIIEDKEI